MPGEWDVVSREEAKPAGEWDVVKHEDPKGSSNLANFGSGFAQGINPFHGMLETIDALGKDPVGTIKTGALNILAHPYVAMSKAWDAAKSGNAELAAAHLQNALDPAGAFTEEANIKAHTPGQRAEGVGQAIGQGVQALVLPKVSEKVPAAASKVKEVATRPGVIKAAGTYAGAHLGGPVGAIIGRELAGDLSDLINKAPEVAANPPEVDAIAKGMGGASYDALTEAGQQTVKRVFDQMRGVKPPPLPKQTSGPGPLPGPIDIGEPPKPPVAPKVRPNVNGAPLRPPMAESAPTPPETAEVPPAASREPLKPPVKLSAEAQSKHVDDLLMDWRMKLRAKLGLPDDGLRLGEVKGGRYPERYDEGSGAPVIKKTPQNIEKALKASLEAIKKKKAQSMGDLMNEANER